MVSCEGGKEDERSGVLSLVETTNDEDMTTVVDTPMVVTAGVDTPVVDTAGVDTPVVVTAGVDTPVVVIAGVDTPVVVTAGVDTPVVVIAGVDSPVDEVVPTVKELVEEKMEDPLAGVIPTTLLETEVDTTDVDVLLRDGKTRVASLLSESEDDMAEDTTEDMAEDTTEDIAEDMVEDTTEDMAEDIVPDAVSEDVSEDDVSDVDRNIAVNVSSIDDVAMTTEDMNVDVAAEDISVGVKAEAVIGVVTDVGVVTDMGVVTDVGVLSTDSLLVDVTIRLSVDMEAPDVSPALDEDRGVSPAFNEGKGVTSTLNEDSGVSPALIDTLVDKELIEDSEDVVRMGVSPADEDDIICKTEDSVDIAVCDALRVMIAVCDPLRVVPAVVAVCDPLRVVLGECDTLRVVLAVCDTLRVVLAVCDMLRVELAVATVVGSAMLWLMDVVSLVVADTVSTTTMLLDVPRVVMETDCDAMLATLDGVSPTLAIVVSREVPDGEDTTEEVKSLAVIEGVTSTNVGEMEDISAKHPTQGVWEVGHEEVMHACVYVCV